MSLSKFTTDEVAVPEAIIRVLEQAGIETIYGLPGGETTRIYDALYDHKDAIRCILVREESLATVMAEVAGRETGKPGVVIGQSSWLFGNGGMGILEAHLGSSPMLILSDLSDGAPYSHHAPYQAGTGEPGTWNARQAFGAITRHTFVAHSAVEAIQLTQLGIKHALGAAPGPIAVLYHSEALRSTWRPSNGIQAYTTSPYLAPQLMPLLPCDEAVKRVAKRVVAARHSVIVAGNGIRLSRAYDSLATFADAIGAPVVTTGAGKGVFAEDHPLAGGVIGTFGLAAANELVRDADLVLAIGTKLGPSDTSNENLNLLDPLAQSIVQVDRDPARISWTYPVTDFLVGDARATMDALVRHLGQFDSVARRAGALHRVQVARGELGYYQSVSPRSTDTAKVLPQQVIETLRHLLPNDAFVTCDAGENRLFMHHFFQVRSPGTFLQPASSGGMGYAIPAALAAKQLYPNSPVVAVCGDGGFSIALNGLLTSVEEDLPITVVVLNNRALGWVLHGQRQRVISSELRDFDYAGIARAIGFSAWKVDDPTDLGDVVTGALGSACGSLIEVTVSAEQSYRTVAWRPRERAMGSVVR